MQFSCFLLAIQNRLAGLIVAGLFKRFEVHQTLELAAYRADLETRIKALRDSGATRSAAYLKKALERMDASSGAAGVERNTATQIWLNASGRDAIDQIQRLGGKAVDHIFTNTFDSQGNRTVSKQEILVDRYDATTIAKLRANATHS